MKFLSKNKFNLQKTRNASRLTYIVLIIIILLIIGILGYYNISKKLSLLNQNSSTESSTTNNQIIFPPSTISNLLFEYSKENQPGSTLQKTISDTSGKIIKTFALSQTDSLYDSISNIGYSRGLVTSNEIYSSSGPTKWAILKYDGSIIPVSPILTGPLNNLSDPYKNSFLTPQNMLLTLIRPNIHDYSPFYYDEFDALTGSKKTLLTITPLNNSFYYPYFQPKTLSYTGDTVSFLVSDVIINSQVVQGTAIAAYNLLSDTLTIHSLPSSLSTLAQTKRGQYEGEIESIGVSPDANLLVYQSSDIQSMGGVNQQIWKTHIYNVKLQTNISFSAISLPGGYDDFFFSPDNSYIVFHDDGGMEIIETSDGKIIEGSTLGNPGYIYDQPIGWIDLKSFVYTTETTDKQGVFDMNNATSHTVNVITHQIHDYSKDLGSVRAILYK